jgi:hypothetical protein
MPGFRTAGVSKNFFINPQPEQHVTAMEDKQNDYSAKIVNTTDGDLTIQWKLIENTLVKGWDYSICNYGQCLAGIPKSGTMKPIKKGEKGFLNLHLNPFHIKGRGTVKFKVYEKGKEDLSDTLTYTVSVN